MEITLKRACFNHSREGFEATNALCQDEHTVRSTATQQEVDNDTGCKYINLSALDADDHAIAGRTVRWGSFCKLKLKWRARSTRPSYYCAIEKTSLPDLQAGSACFKPKQPARCSACPG